MPSQEQTFLKRDLLPVVIIAAIGVVIVLPIFVRGFPAGADIRHHYKWAYYFCEALREGIPYPRWLAGANRGYGSPVMFYYPPLALYVVAAFNAITGNLLHAIKLSCGLSMIASGASMYVFSKGVLSRTGALAAALLYMSAPYHIFELYRVNALSEYWALVWVPLVLHAIRRISIGEGWRAAACLAASYGLMLLTHIPVSLIITAILPVFVLALTRNKRDLVMVASGIALGMGLAAGFLVSVLFETKYVHINQILENDYLKAFLFEDFSAFSWSNLLSTADYPNVAGYVREANLVAVAGVVLLLVASIVLLLERRSIRKALPEAADVGAVWLVAIVSMLMTTRLSEPLWRAFKNLQYLQSPVRWLAPATVAIAFLTSAALLSAARARKRVLLAAPLAVAIAVNVAISIHVSTQRPVELEGLENKLLRRDVPEYTPLWWDGEFHEEFEQSASVVEDGDAEIRAVDDAGLKQRYEVNARTPATLKFRSVWFPGWTALVDGERVEPGRSIEGNIQIDVSPGSHIIVLKFGETWRHIRAYAVSGISLLILASILYSTRGSNKRSAEHGDSLTVERAPAHLEGSDYQP